MAQGFLAGLLWGGVAGVGLLAVSTQVIVRQDLSQAGPVDSGQPETSAVEVPAGTEFDQAREATDPEIPAEETRPGGEAVSGVSPPEDLGTTPPAFDTSALEMPQPIEAPGGLGDVPTPAEEVAVDVTGPGEDVPAIAPVVPLAAPTETGPAPETDTAAPEIEVPDAAELPEVEAPLAEVEAPEVTEAAPEMAEEPVETAPEVEGAAPEIPSAPEAPAIMTAPAVPQASDAPVVVVESEPTRPQVEAAPAQPVVAESAPPVETEAPQQPVVVEDMPEPVEETPSEAVGDASEVADAPLSEAEDMPDVAEVPEPMAEDAPAEADTSAPEVAEPVATDEPEVELAQVTPEPEPLTERESELEPEETLSEGETDPSEDAAAPRVRPAPGAGGGLPRVIRLIGDDEEPATEEDAPEEDAATPADPDAPAIERFSVPVEIGLGEAIMSVVILHEGPVPDTGAIAALPSGLTFAVDAGSSDAEAVSRAYRDAGREVVMIPNLPEKARPQDVEQAMQANLRAVPEAVAVMDTTGGGFQSDREAVAQVVDAIGATGHGLITFPRGLNTAHQRAEREGVPRGLIFRDIDGKGESGAEIGRSLDRAAFRARQSRQSVILVGRSRADTLAAVAAWAAANGGGGVVLAPVSAALLAGR